MSLLLSHSTARPQTMEIRLHDASALAARFQQWESYLDRQVPLRPLSLDPGWLTVLSKGLKHEVFALEALEGDQTKGLLLLAYVRSLLFGRYLVSLPYLNYGGVLADDATIARQLLDRAVVLAGELKVRYLEVRHQEVMAHEAFGESRTDKVNMRLELPKTSEQLWTRLSGKVRNQVRKAQKSDLTAAWGTTDLLADFYRVFSHNMRDLGTPSYGKKASHWQAPLVGIPDRGPLDWNVVNTCLDLCRKEKVRIWHGHDYKSNALGLLLRTLWPMKLVTTVHGWVNHTRRTPLYYFIDRVCLPRYDQVICVSKDLYDASRRAGVSARSCHLVENAIDTNEFCRRDDVAAAKSRFDVPADRLILGAAGRLAPEKGFDLLIQAVHRLLQAGRNVELWVLGDGPEKERLQKLADELGCGARVKLLGYVADVRARFECMDVFVLSSLREGLPNVVLEAMALEVPVAATRVAGVPLLIEDGVSGLLLEPGSVEALTQTLAQVLDNPEQRQHLARRGRQTVTKRYSFTARMQRIRQLYDELLQRPSN